ncbi:MAG TPA: hypothetical protein H9846_04425 [Candidatus Gemmiger excrementipullorum]|uniref:Uncharacterized protein n=1 Tax=Candidatus Gemmiger excrementipullorum TaxID=2838610 RepID=A0A9D1Y0K9_9FIRM|nr:hypothetical protein [Candidatus Gemmiger excrementipullorum]
MLLITRGSIRKQSRKTLPAKRHLLRYRVLYSTKECCAPLPCICRFAALLRCFAVFTKPLFSYVTRAFLNGFAGSVILHCGALFGIIQFAAGLHAGPRIFLVRSNLP